MQAASDTLQHDGNALPHPNTHGDQGIPASDIMHPIDETPPLTAIVPATMPAGFEHKSIRECPRLPGTDYFLTSGQALSDNGRHA